MESEKREESAIGAPPSFGVMQASPGNHPLPVATGMHEILDDSGPIDVGALIETLQRTPDPPVRQAFPVAAESAVEPQETGIGLLAAILLVVLVAGLGVSGWWYVSRGSSDRSAEVAASTIVPEPAPAKVEREIESPSIEIEDPAPVDPDPIAPPSDVPPSIETPPPPPLAANRPATKPRSIASVAKKKKKSREEDRPTPVPSPAREPAEEPPPPPPPKPQEKKGVASVLDGGIRPMQRGGQP